MGLCQCSKRIEGIRGIDLKDPCVEEFKGCKGHEKEVYLKVEELLARTDAVHKSIEEYKGCQELARAAMSKPSQETEEAAFEGLLKAVESIQTFYNFSRDMEKIFPELVNKLAEYVHLGDNLCHLHEVPNLTRQLAKIFDFTLKFDRIRMLRPNLSNDFSYYRRLLPKFNKHADIKVKDDEASGMALFTAEHIPMTTCLAKSGAKAQEMLVIADGKAADGKIGYVLATMANSCLLLLKNESPPDSEKMYIARAMTGSVVIFDHVDHAGAFHRRTPIAIKAIIQMLKNNFSSELSLVNAIRYSTKNFRDAPMNIQDLFD